jgi:hypothetical protein
MSHIVKRGETLGMIADQYGTSVDQIMYDNGLSEGDRIRPGDLLCISDPGFEWKYPNAEMLASVSLKAYTVQVVGGGFPVRYRFLVKVRVNRAGPWKRVGALRTTRYGDFDVTFNLPRDVKYIRRLDVCLKDILEGYLVCDRVQHIKPGY